MGRGTLDLLKTEINDRNVKLLIVDHSLSPVQQRNLEKELTVKVLDRTGLILEIFGARAKTREGRFQVELAHLSYQKGRLVRSWTHLERQRGGVGFLGGPGETQIESDRRALQTKITKIKSRIEQVRKNRSLQRTNRKKSGFPAVALVGYTNAGKSTLFNTLTNSGVLAQDQLFATLDPTIRAVELPRSRQKIIMSDTVGFVSDLPTHLVAAFRATLEEVIHADLILHVRDIAHADSEIQCEDVHKTLEQLGILETSENRILEVWNKCDLLTEQELEFVENKADLKESSTNNIPISAETGEGISALLSEIDTHVFGSRLRLKLAIPADKGDLISQIYQSCTIHEVHEHQDNAIMMDISMDEQNGTLDLDEIAPFKVA